MFFTVVILLLGVLAGAWFRYLARDARLPWLVTALPAAAALVLFALMPRDRSSSPPGAPSSPPPRWAPPSAPLPSASENNIRNTQTTPSPLDTGWFYVRSREPERNGRPTQQTLPT